jgi:hypothetical protein
MMLIYQGGKGRPKWTADELSPYVSWQDPESSQPRWLFDTFLFLELRSREDTGMTAGFGTRPANKSEWLEYLVSMFAAGEALSALDAQVGSLGNRIGAPLRPRQVVLSPPEPISGFKDWGQLDGRRLDFSKAEDRLVAYQWFTAQMYDRYAKAKFKNLRLAGFYWLPESVGDDGSSFTQFLAGFSHSRGLKSFYIPFFGAQGAANYREHGLDIAWLQPNYFFTPTIPEQRLHETTRIAREHQIGLEMEWDGRVIDPSTSATFAPRMWRYMRAFEADGVWANATVAHYEGGGGLLQLSRSKRPEARKLMDTYCRIIAERQEKHWH